MEPDAANPGAALAVRAQGGDRDAFASLVELHWIPLVRLARSVVGDQDAEDEVQEALVVAWRELPSLRDPTAFSSWLHKVVLRRCLRLSRRLLRLVPLERAPEPVDPHNHNALPGEQLVEQLLGQLAPQQRAVMHLTVIEGWSDSEIGALLGIAAASVRSHRRRAKERLEKLWNAHPRN